MVRKRRIAALVLGFMLAGPVCIADDLPEQFGIAVKQTTWQAASAAKKQKVKTFIKNHADDNFTSEDVTYMVHPSDTSAYWLVAVWWTDQMEITPDKISTAKLSVLTNGVTGPTFRIGFDDDFWADLYSNGLYAVDVP